MSDLLTVEVRRAIAEERDRRNLTTNKELAQQLGILPKHISKWQNGHFTRLDRVLVELLLKRQQSAQTSS
jgi:transcriptional regulator with XRE-family HTH domain